MRGPINLNGVPTPTPMATDRRGAGVIVGVCPGTIDNLRKRGELPSFTIGARRLYAIADLEALIASRRGGVSE